MKRSSALYLLIAASLAIPGTAFSQWQWKEANGRTVYSDTPPPPSVPERAILAAPGRMAGAYRPLESETAKADGKADTKATPANGPRMQTVSAKAKADKPVDADDAFRERRDARIKADLDAATKERDQLARDDRCQQLRNYATGLSAGVRVSRSAADGAPVRLNDDERAAELARTNDSINQQCAS
ncbi:DUF4124 domain-containing protein [Cupriavidus pauculus]|uniref:DUF4124 domain-containing protein n=1 Tax=Cupriavidus pauculus TaxID=82633 RepID=A0A2N5C6H4_9BURK|nr:DUF4124 domain-containing protein [Cupriavidus pauculus]PLP97819.1 DUF4124 domain-containing protein [Cupriavidus pauculus]